METPTTNKNKSSKENWKKAAAMAGAAMAGAGAVAAVDVLRENEEAEDVKPTTEEQTATQQAHDPSTEDAAGPTSNAHTQSAAPHQAPHHHQGANHHQAHQHQDAQAQTAQAQQQAQPDQHPTTPEDETATQNVAQNQPTGTAATDHVEVINVEETPDINPSLVAQDLTDDADDDILVTPNDLEAEHIDLAATDTIETVDGETIQATPIANDSAEPVYMVDINTGDNTHTDDLTCAPDTADDLCLSPSDDANATDDLYSPMNDTVDLG